MIEFHDVFRWFHVVLMAYWLGGEWGVFNASSNFRNRNLDYDERKRHLDTAFRIDIVPRSAIVLLLPVGFQLGANLGVSPVDGPWLVAIWIASFAWVGLVWAAYANRGTPRGTSLTIWDERIRYVVIPVLLIAGITSLITGEPFTANWFAAKITIFGLLLIIGLFLRWTFRAWLSSFQRIAAEGPSAEAEQTISGGFLRSRNIAYIYWVLIISVAFLGVVKPF